MPMVKTDKAQAEQGWSLAGGDPVVMNKGGAIHKYTKAAST